MTGRRLAAWFAAAFALGLLLWTPLQLVLPRLQLPPGLAATAVEGSVWNGRLREARWHDARIGDLRLGLSPLPLLAGRQRLWMQTPAAGLVLRSGRIRGIDDGNGVLPLPGVAGLGLRASLEDARLLFDDAGCAAAGGRVRVELAFPAGVLEPVLLSGVPACEGRSGVLELLPEQPGGALGLEATLAVEGDGRWRLQARARSDDPAVRAALSMHGFQDAPGGSSRVIEGGPGAR